ncbi:MAG: DEAD/DEAH box helicase [Planctomycetaceae bacterium]|nr:DEAD/DEAH box helicase [Planctomycetaceae bacterium]
MRAAFASKRIPFVVSPSVSMALTVEREVRTTEKLAETVSQEGRAFLAKKVPQLHPFQVEGALFLARTQRALLLDEMGLGKTIQSIAAACLLRKFAGIQSCLIIAPKSVLKNWATEIFKFIGEQCVIISGTDGKREELYRRKEFFKAVTLESFRKDYPNTGKSELIIVDEVHKCRDITTLSSRVLRSVESPFLFGLSGTAIEKSLDDLYGILRVLRAGRLETPLEFAATHLACNDFGKVVYTAHPEFFYIRHSDRIRRRLKSEVDNSIPALNVVSVALPLTPIQDELAIPMLSELEELCERLRERYETNDFIRRRWLINRIVELSNSSELIDPSTHGSSKLEWLRDFLQATCTCPENKVVVFTRWTRCLKMICTLCDFLNLKYVKLTGDTKTDERLEVVHQFTNDLQTLVFISTDAGGVGINLQVARIVVNLEPAWNPSVDSQRIQRLHRLGQTREVTAYLPQTILDAKFTLETHGKKQWIADQIDGARFRSMQDLPPAWGELLSIIRHIRETVA